MEIQDVSLVELISQQVNKKLSLGIYMRSLGKVCGYKVITKSLEKEHIMDYLTMHLSKIQVWKRLGLKCQHSEYPFTHETSEFYTALQIMKRVRELDLGFNIENEEQEINTNDFEKWQDDLQEGCEDEKSQALVRQQHKEKHAKPP